MIVFRTLYLNQLTGTIPSSIGYLAQLQYLYVHSCFQFHPPIQIKTNTNCSIFCMFRDLSANQLSGTIPSSIGNLTKVQSLYVPSCIQFHQQTHISLTLSTICMFRYLSQNQLSGTIPSSIGNLAQLQTLYVHSCFQFHQQTTSNSLFQPKLLYFCVMIFRILFGNQLSGTIPSSIGNLTKVQSLYVPSCIQFHQQTKS